MFIGEYIHTIDEKNRLSLPVKFRAKLGKKIVITPGLDGCIFGFTVEAWKEISSKLAQSSLLQSDTRSFNRYMFGGAVEVDVDTIGRILIPDFHRDRAALKNKVAIVGVQDRLEIWNEKAWVEYKAVVEKQAEQLAEKFGQVGLL